MSMRTSTRGSPHGYTPFPEVMPLACAYAFVDKNAPTKKNPNDALVGAKKGGLDTDFSALSVRPVRPASTAYIMMAYLVMAYIVMARYSYGLYSCGLFGYGLHSYGLYSYGPI